jgi:hypothetical protein
MMKSDEYALVLPCQTFAGTCCRQNKHLQYHKLTRLAVVAIMAVAIITIRPMIPFLLAAVPTVIPLLHPFGGTVQEAQSLYAMLVGFDSRKKRGEPLLRPQPQATTMAQPQED